MFTEVLIKLLKRQRKLWRNESRSLSFEYSCACQEIAYVHDKIQKLDNKIRLINKMIEVLEQGEFYATEPKEFYGWLKDELMDKGLTDGEATYTINRISRACRKKDCIDNIRISVNGQHDDEYEHRRSNGCCGFHDEVVELHSGIKVKFGFNYGH